MANVQRKLISVWNGFSVLKATIDSFQLPFLTTEIFNVGERTEYLLITFESGATWKFYYEREDWYQYIRVQQLVQGVSVIPGWVYSDNVSHRGLTFTFCSSPTLFYMKLHNTYDSGTPWFSCLYEKVTDSFSVAGIIRSDRVSNITLYDVDTASPYQHPVALNYSTSIGTIQYMDHANISASGIKYYNDSNLISCTAVSVDNVITFNGSNYWAIDANLLIPMDAQT